MDTTGHVALDIGDGDLIAHRVVGIGGLITTGTGQLRRPAVQVTNIGDHITLFVRSGQSVFAGIIGSRNMSPVLVTCTD